MRLAQLALHLAGIGNGNALGFQVFGPERGMTLFRRGQALQDGPPPLISLRRGQLVIGERALHLVPPIAQHCVDDALVRHDRPPPTLRQVRPCDVRVPSPSLLPRPRTPERW